MEEPSHCKIQKRSDGLDFKSSLLGPENRKYRKTFFVTLGIGVVVAGIVLAFGRAFATVLLGYMPMNLTIAFVVILLVLFVLIDRGVLLKPKPLSSAERDRFASLKGETPEEIKELIGFNLRTGNRKKANEWAAKALKLSNGDSVPKIEKKN